MGSRLAVIAGGFTSRRRRRSPGRRARAEALSGVITATWCAPRARRPEHRIRDAETIREIRWSGLSRAARRQHPGAARAALSSTSPSRSKSAVRADAEPVDRGARARLYWRPTPCGRARLVFWSTTGGGVAHGRRARRILVPVRLFPEGRAWIERLLATAHRCRRGSPRVLDTSGGLAYQQAISPRRRRGCRGRGASTGRLERPPER